MHQFKREFARLLRHSHLLKSTLLLAQIENPNYDYSQDTEYLLTLASQAWNLFKNNAEPSVKVRAINHVLFYENGFQGKGERFKTVIDDPKRLLLNHIIHTKVTSPISLTILYWIMAEQIGLELECVALASDYVLRIKDNKQELYIDPFEKGKLLGAEEFLRKFRLDARKHHLGGARLFERLDKRQLLARLVEQIKQVYILKGDVLPALRAVEILSVFYPNAPEISRDRGILYCEMEYFSKAEKELQIYLRQRPKASDTAEIRKLTHILSGYREVVN